MVRDGEIAVAAFVRRRTDFAKAAGVRYAPVAKDLAMLDHPVQLTLALFAALLGFGGISGPAAQAAQYALVVALILLLVSLRADKKRRGQGTRLQAWRQTRFIPPTTRARAEPTRSRGRSTT